MSVDNYGGNDGVEETFETVLRAGIAASARVAEAMARLRQQLQERAAAQSTEAARDLQQRLEAELTLARATYRGVEDPAWWSRAEPADVENAYRAAAIWREVDTHAARAYDTMNTEIAARYGITVETPASADSDLARSVQDLERRAEVDLAEAVVLLAAADRSDQAAARTLETAAVETAPAAGPAAADAGRSVAPQSTGNVDRQAGKVAWDSAERREATARSLAAAGIDPSVVEAAMLADVAQALPATEATRQRRGGAAKARKRRGQNGIQKERGLGR